MPSQQPNPWRLVGLGTEFAGATLVLGLLGWYIDQKAGSEPWGLVIGLLVGAIGGLYLLIKEAIKANR
jgi:F0F1-type ATP synthase assembly protein I